MKDAGRHEYLERYGCGIMKLYRYRDKNRVRGRRAGSVKRLLAVCLTLAMIAGALSGCGGSPAASTEEPGAAAEDGTGAKPDAQGGREQSGDGTSESEPIAMGRYVETMVDISENASHSYNISMLADGRLLILDEGAGQLISADNGETWETVPIPGIDSMKTFSENNYILSMAAAPDGTVAVLYSRNEDFDKTGEFAPWLHVAKPDGTVQTLDTLPVQPEDNYVYNLYYSPEGVLFATVVGTGTIYQVDVERGTLTKAVALEWQPDLVRVQGDNLFFLVSGEGVSIYDRRAEKWVEDSVLADFMEENYKGQYFTGAGYTAYMATDEDGVLYIAGKGGVYRHVIGGSAMEQIIDGALSGFSNPSMTMIGITAFGDNAFAALFDGTVALYHYDSGVPTVPENMISVYSLYEQDAVRQAIAQFQTENPDAFVRYEVGLSGMDAKAREDAVKKLNTELMAGKGPDVLILDGLPVKSYEEKGILKDLKPHIDSLSGDAVLLPNIVEAFNHGGSVYMMPVSFSVPMVMGRQEDIAGITDYASLADTVEKIRQEHPEAMIGGFFSEESMMRWFLPVTAASFVEESGEINEVALKEYLSLTNRIYTASQEGISDEIKELYGYQKDNYTTGQWAYQNFNDVNMDTYFFLIFGMELTAGMLKDAFGYHKTISLKYCEGCEDVRIQTFGGMSEGVFEPAVLVGISAGSAHQEEAERFFDTIMGTQVQGLLYDGFMVNQSALENQLSPQWAAFQNDEDTDYGEVYGSVGGSYGDGAQYRMDVYMPKKEEFQALYELCCKVKTPYVADSVVENAVIETGARYLSGSLSLEEAVDKIMAKIEIYMAE